MDRADWQVEIDHTAADVAMLDAAFDEHALAIASFEVSEASGAWRTTLLFGERPERAWLEECLNGLPYRINPVEQKDWVAETQAGFPPVTLGRFLVLGSHHHDVCSTGKLILHMDAGAAFGTGEHATTAGCLQALEWIIKILPPASPPARQTRCARALARRVGLTPSATKGLDLLTLLPVSCKERRPVGRLSHEPAKRRPIASAGGASRGHQILDMGCGSGILAIAAAKLCHVPVLGVEIDPVATSVAAANFQRNRLHGLCRAITGNGYRAPEVRGEYTLIFSNILAGPLVRFAPELAQHLAPGGYAVLSGLLNHQASWVLAAHRAQQIYLVKRIVIGEWTTLILGR